ncbi:hypothetical protein F5146DRAFT_1030416, partial [Armillaria mellea]
MDLQEDATFSFPGIKNDVSIDVHNGRLTVSPESDISDNHKVRWLDMLFGKGGMESPRKSCQGLCL